jgi:hypothetical protein
MATEEIAFKITTDTGQSEKSVKSIKTQLKEANLELIDAQKNFGNYSQQALDAAKKVAILRDNINEARETSDLFDPGKKFQAFSGVLQTTAAGYAGLQGAIGLFGTESKELERQLLKVQSALALSQGLSSIADGAKSFQRLGTIIKTQVVTAFSTLRGAIIATGIGALAIGIALIAANFEKVKQVVLNLIPGLAKVGEFISKLVNSITDFVGATSEASRAYDSLAKSNKSANEEINRRIKLLQAQGGKEAEIAKLSKQLAENDLNNLRAKLKAEGKLNEEDLKQFKDLKAQKTVIDLQETNRLKNEQEKRLEDQKKAYEKAAQLRKENDAKIKKEEEERLLKLGEIRVNNFQSEQKEIKNRETLRLNLIKESDKESENFLKTSANTKLGISTLLQSKQVSLDAQTYAKFNENAELDLKIKTLKAQGEIELLNAVANTASILSDVAGRETAAGKALAVAQALINTYQGIAAGVKLGYPAAIPAVLAASVTGFKAVKSIVAVKVPGGASGGGSSIPSSNSFTQNAVAAPIRSGINVQQTALTPNGNNVNIQNQQAIKAFVVERDITDSQDRINKIKQAATI